MTRRTYSMAMAAPSRANLARTGYRSANSWNRKVPPVVEDRLCGWLHYSYSTEAGKVV